VNVTVGSQLSTVLETVESDVAADVEETRVEVELEAADERERAEVLAERAESLREEARAIREQFRETTRAYERGDLDRSEYAQRIAVLNARASNLLASYDRLDRRVANASGFELAAAGMNRSALRAAVGDLENLTGTGPSALLERFVGERAGEVELERADGLSIEVESEDGERSRELERPRDDDDATTVDQATALETARASLSEQAGNWTLARASVHPESGYYRFEFSLRTGNETGEAEVRVDGSTGEVFRLEEEIERREDDEGEDDEGEDDEGEDDEGDEFEELALFVADGSLAPNATVTVKVLADGEPLPNATVRLDGAVVGETGPDGTVALTLPAGSSTVTVAAGEEDAELEFEFEREDDEHDRREVYRSIRTTASLDGDTVSLTATYDGSGIGNVTVYANGERVGRTAADGRLTFTTDATEELELELVRGELEAELTYRIADGSLVLEEAAHEGDGDRADDDEEDDETEADEDEDGDDETEEDDETETAEPTETEEDDETETAEPTETEEDDETETAEPTETEEDVDDLSLSVVAGDSAPGATITVEVTADGDPVAGATVSVEGEVVGETGDDGTIAVTLPDDEDDPRVRAETDDASGRIEFDFEED
jgi:hypothetical protein